MGTKVGVILSGCGVYDGAEIHESVITLLALDRRGAEAVLCAPDRPQLHVVNHLTGEVEEGASRNVLVESARIARGAIRDVAAVSADELDALILPGGFGAAKNLCDFAVRGAECEVDDGVAALVRAVHAQGKPVAAVCIAPALLARVLGSEGPELTIGTDPGTAGALESMGATHVQCPVREFVVDRERKLITSPAYMLAASISEAADGIEGTVKALLDMA
ncbi:MAG TPA: isoprenoid biosynthesis glyoxalase ElbB [Candidatus Sulfomarinibacteraceae bacterium]|nr:isoprenoid biosynthesis glyoxalase ElbB [Candidatus Sulfomarinibacteraceae bacterium]